ncbi:UvrD-helicase domain-containing protein [Microscilla marina]|uniref:DNA 3'-5' helicase n=1 Tax=Microscilla marina ATCC 23134 TaxID=313606 RepID=A1ZU89_MICM2|nr:ATP-dependent helicase [Microscilla marina]EAY26060.1 ATP-dependent DNA helicase PcrA [Microscilla marina ATCC 23134]
MPDQTPSIEALWQAVGFTPNQSQEEAIRHTDGPLFLTAGPGSGKTRVLLWKCLYLIVHQQVAPEHIFLATFTEKAALQLKEGLQSLLGLVTNRTNQTFDLSKMYVGTVHSLCNRLITDRRFGQKKGADKKITPIDDLEQYFHISNRKIWTAMIAAGGLDDLPAEEQNQYINDYLAENHKKGVSRYNAIMHLMALFNRFTEECLDVATLNKIVSEEPMKKMVKMYAFYLDSLQEKWQEKLDFSLVQQKGLEVMQNFGGEANEKFKYVIIDEYQDTNTIQEKLFFKLAEVTQNLCVVGDDDQALYRFRGATVENFVEFEERCKQYYPKGKPVTKIPLNINYRSRKKIVDFYTSYIGQTNWQKEDDPTQQYRVHTKQISAHSTDDQASVFTTDYLEPEQSFEQIAQFIQTLLNQQIIEDPNQVAFLFPSLGSTQVPKAQAALESLGLRTYAPRAQPFLKLPEARSIMGIFLRVFGKPERDPEFNRGDFKNYHDWMEEVYSEAGVAIRQDAGLKALVEHHRSEITTSISDYKALMAKVEASNELNLDDAYDFEKMPAQLKEASISPSARKSLSSTYLLRQLKKQMDEGGKSSFTLRDVITRATSLNWNPLDLFYKILAFKEFKTMMDAAGKSDVQIDEGPIYNLGLLTGYISRFLELYKTVLRAKDLESKNFKRAFFIRFWYTIYKKGETEFENSEDPFPRGRIPFLTIHQSKGLEFPVVVLGNTVTRSGGVRRMEELMKPLLGNQGEPLTRMDEFDKARMFYVALSRAENLLIVANYKRGISKEFKAMLAQHQIPVLGASQAATVPSAKLSAKAPMKAYSYTSDYLLYERCPRQYMVFRKYGFVPSRSQTMFFGSLVHQTIDDLHNFIIDNPENLDLDLI